MGADVLEASGDASSDYLKNLYNQLSEVDGRVVVVHLGHDKQGSSFKLEVLGIILSSRVFVSRVTSPTSRCCAQPLFATLFIQGAAYNEASFRCPDERGWMPVHERIDPKREIRAILESSVPLEIIESKQEHFFPTTNHISKNRFLT